MHQNSSTPIKRPLWEMDSDRLKRAGKNNRKALIRTMITQCTPNTAGRIMA